MGQCECDSSNSNQKMQNTNSSRSPIQSKTSSYISSLNNSNIIKPLKNLNRNSLIYSETNLGIKIAKIFLINECGISLSLLDNKGDLDSNFNGWRMNSFNGPPGYLKNFYPPIGWTTIGLKVWGKYDKGDNTWFGTSNVLGEWYIGYHGIKTKNSIYGILTNGFIKGPNQSFANYKNINPLSYKNYYLCQEGAYFTPEINEARSYTDIIKYNQYNLRIVFMCRINPYKVRIADKRGIAEYWITNGGTDEVRPYRILFKFENNAY